MEKNKEYVLELKVKGRQIEAFIDNKDYHSIECKPVVIEPIYCTSSLDKQTGEIIIKVVNVSNCEQNVRIDVLNNDISKGSVSKLYGHPLDATNDFENPEKIMPISDETSVHKNKFEYIFEKQSITIIRLN